MSWEKTLAIGELLDVKNLTALYLYLPPPLSLFYLSLVLLFLSFLLSSSLLLGKHLVHVGYWKESNNLLVVGLPAER